MSPCLSVVRDGEHGVRDVATARFLLVRPRDVEAAERALAGVVDRYVVGSPAP